MHALSCAFFALALAAQVPAPPRQSQWLTDLQKIQQEMYQAPLGSLDAKVERAWRAALEAPQYPQLQSAAQMASNFYQSQGYDLKAEQVLRQALAAVPEIDAQTRRSLTWQLASLFEGTQQLVKALAIREGMVKGPQPPPSYELISLANLYERMGELEKAEAAWQEVAVRRAAEAAPKPSGSGQRTIAVSSRFGYGGGAQNELASFYARHGRAAEAEQLYKKGLADAAQSSSAYEWDGAAEGYAGFLSQQRRFDEAVDLIRQSIARFEQSSDPQAARMLVYKRQRLADVLAQAGRADEALAAQKQAVEAALPGTVEYTQALGSLAQTLINQNRLEEAEKTVAEMREAGAADTRNAQFNDTMAVQTLARIRDMQKRPEEARQLRASLGGPDPRPTVYDVVGPALQAAYQGNADLALASVDRALALAAERMSTDPYEVSGLVSLARVLMDRQKQAEARYIAAETLRILDRAPDHPRIVEALRPVPPMLAQLGMATEAERVIERQEKILTGAKGADSPALDVAGYGRIELMQHDRNWTGVIDERKGMLARTEKATGSKSRESLNALRDVAMAYPPLGNWPEEERILSTVLERTVSLSGASSMDRMHLLQHMANRARQNGQFEKALGWMDQAIEVARALPDANAFLPGMLQNRADIVRAKDPPPANRLGNRPADAAPAQVSLPPAKR